VNKKHLQSTLFSIATSLRLPVSIRKYYGRLGNNFQQISLAIMYAEKYGLGVIIPEHSMVRGFKLGVTPFWPGQISAKNRFYYY